MRVACLLNLFLCLFVFQILGRPLPSFDTDPSFGANRNKIADQPAKFAKVGQDDKGHVTKDVFRLSDMPMKNFQQSNELSATVPAAIGDRGLNISTSGYNVTDPMEKKRKSSPQKAMLIFLLIGTVVLESMILLQAIRNVKSVIIEAYNYFRASRTQNVSV